MENRNNERYGTIGQAWLSFLMLFGYDYWAAHTASEARRRFLIIGSSPGVYRSPLLPSKRRFGRRLTGVICGRVFCSLWRCSGGRSCDLLWKLRKREDHTTGVRRLKKVKKGCVSANRRVFGLQMPIVKIDRGFTGPSWWFHRPGSVD